MRRLALAAICTLFSACVPHQQWRTKLDLPAPVEQRFVIPPELSQNRIYSIAFVEFKNSGEPWDTRQLDAALRAIDEADQRSGHRAFVITFIHGWKNNAGQSNNNVLDFRRQLNRVAADVCKGDLPHCGVVGIYLAWSGDVIDRNWNTLRTLTYFNRRDTAAKVASAPIGNALFAIMKRTKTGPGREANHSVVVGHSFGGLVLEYAIEDRMKTLGDELRTELGKSSSSEGLHLKALDDFADLVVFINQAAPATNAVTLLSEYRDELGKVNILRPPKRANCAAGDTSQDCKQLMRPLILSISSESDLATRAFLPIAETISPLKNPAGGLPAGLALPPGLDAKTVLTATAAHTPQLHSHSLELCENGDCSSCSKDDDGYIPASINLPAFAPGNVTGKDRPIKYCLVREADAWNTTPYWIFQIPTEVVPDHGTIFTDRFTDFLTAFLPPLNQFRPDQPAHPMQRLQRRR